MIVQEGANGKIHISVESAHNVGSVQMTGSSTKEWKFGNMGHWIELYILDYCVPADLVSLACLNRRWRIIIDHPELWSHLFDRQPEFLPALNPKLFHDSTRKFVTKKMDTLVNNAMKKKQIQHYDPHVIGQGREVYVEIMKDIVNTAKKHQRDKKCLKERRIQSHRTEAIKEFHEKGCACNIIYILCVLPVFLILSAVVLDRILLWSWMIALIPCLAVINVQGIVCCFGLCYWGSKTRIQLWNKQMKHMINFSLMGTLLSIAMWLTAMRASNIVAFNFPFCSTILFPLLFVVLLVFTYYLWLISYMDNFLKFIYCLLLSMTSLILLLVALKIDQIITASWILVLIPFWIPFTFYFVGPTCFFLYGMVNLIQEEASLINFFFFGIILGFPFWTSIQVLLVVFKLEGFITRSWFFTFSPIWIYYGFNFVIWLNIALFSIVYRVVTGSWYNHGFLDFTYT